MDDKTSASELFNAYYYAHDCGEPYIRNEAWLRHFDLIAERICQTIQPATVLDVGCAIGLLVEVFRQRGVQSWGIDISEFAIQNVHPDVRAYCRVGSITDPYEFPKYDLIICMEVLEHLPREDADRAIATLCQHSDDILFSSTPFDYNEATHFNVQPTEFWVECFARHGFFRDVDFDASFITAWAVRFRRQKITHARLARDYERQLIPLLNENIVMRKQVINNRHQLENFEQRLLEEKNINQTLVTRLNESDQTYQTMICKLEQLEQENQTLSEQLNTQVQVSQVAHQQISSLTQLVYDKDHTIQEILTSRSWRLMLKFQKVRLRLIPLGSRRERLMHSFLAGTSLLFKKGPLAFARRLKEKISRQLKILTLRKRSTRTLSTTGFHVEPIQKVRPGQVAFHQTSVDIVVCVHDAPDDVQRCLESIVRYTLPPYRLILVDDGSAAPTQQYLLSFAHSQGAVLLRNDQACGYTLAANQGLRQSSAPYVLLLNSDTIVSPNWLDQMVACAESDSKIGVVGPLSNTASWQSIPHLFDASGDWAENQLPPDLTIPDMATWVASYSARQYPRLPFLNGFCLLIKRTLIDDIGIFDEENFGQGYGEENDYCLRATKAGWQLAVADDTYIFHAQSRSYSHERRKALVELSDKALANKHGQSLISDGAYFCRFDRVMQGNRGHSQVIAICQQTIEAGRKRWEGKRLLFILPIAEPGGGGHVIMQEAEAMLKMGVDVRFLNLRAHQHFFEKAYPDLPIPCLYVDSPRLASDLLYAYDAVVGTVYHSLSWMDLPKTGGRLPVRGYYIQDFEPNFFPKGSPEYQAAWDSYTRFPNMVRITKTAWNRQMILDQIGVDCHVVGASLDLELFRPRQRKDPNWPDRPLRITAMVRPSTPRRQPGFTLQVLQEMLRRHAGTIEVILFGCNQDDPDFHKLLSEIRGAAEMPWRNAGVLTRAQLASLLNEVDVFTDFSSFQAMGLTAMEAMACGVAVVVPQEGGADSFARHKENAIITDTTSFETSVNHMEMLIFDETLRSKLQQQSIFDMTQFYPEKAAYKILEALFH